ncbi:sodium-independent sulfate anion transporter-like [Malaya genurostris]|uniref:sodium-independent sulfate anion transporter-like n=1 Tax=Malaya genurostris TaxID=325434 RepID=UPI0026F3C33F|nr:sodium-independent sulfate anion transporter-like [Malaya genurostris]XP_058459688.1 sodium-independent sulfate anion transporter-like [Malaya genurostris]XP_058459698.1 sodium-independent sulfate anion transporter-like [Malaya genurostris]XP_058459707.1 sodium-independent sulfate anion transporter-like [Malaya genurostris]XP_058459715.1 sodium-independent sulfate anion transporter-like [Malaya genurostris]XP_058459724.1 sodium-independent sulfate anion transporter-like [Malaya genurostris]
MTQTMGTTISPDGSYVNEAMNCSSLNISMSAGEPHGGLTGSNEFILSSSGKKITSESRVQEVNQWCQRKVKSACTRKMMYKRLPILRWLPNYNSTDAIGDLVAGITVGLTVIPQALAYSGIAGLPVAYGLYGSFLGSIVYIFLGSCKDVPMGPTAIASLLTYQTARGNVPKAILLCFLTGIVELLMGLFGLGFLVDFVSGPVSSGFTSAVSLIIVTSQIKDVLGITARGSTFLEIWQSIFADIHNIRAWDTVLGITCIAVLLIMRIVAGLKVGPEEEELKSKKHRYVNKFMWLIGTSRNAILVIVCGAIGYVFQSSATAPFKLIGEIPPGMPSFEPPSFSLTANQSSNGREESFSEVVSSLGSGLIVIPLIALMENIAICKAFSNGKPVDATQELIAIGVANIANSFVQGFPGTGSLSRSAVNNASGVRTPLGNIYTGALVLLSLLFFTPYFSYIPKATLAAIIIAAVVFMVEVKVVKPMWRTKKSDLIPGLGTFIACLALPLEIGILLGVGLNVVFILYHAARPKISVERLTSPAGAEYLIITPDRCLIFPSVDYVRNLVTKHSIRQSLPVVIDCSHVYGADFTAATVIDSITQDFVKRDQPLFFYNLKPSVCAVFEGLSPADFVVYYREEDLDQLMKERAYTPKQVLSA